MAAMLARKGTVLSIWHGRSNELRRWERCWQEKLLPYELNTEIPIKLCLPQTATTLLVSCETKRVQMSSLCWAGLQVNTINYNTIKSCCIVFKHQNLGSFSSPPSLHVHNLNVADHTLCVMFVCLHLESRKLSGREGFSQTLWKKSILHWAEEKESP